MRCKIFAALSRGAKHHIRLRWPQNTLNYLKIASTFKKTERVRYKPWKSEQYSTPTEWKDQFISFLTAISQQNRGFVYILGRSRHYFGVQVVKFSDFWGPVIFWKQIQRFFVIWRRMFSPFNDLFLGSWKCESIIIT